MDECVVLRHVCKRFPASRRRGEVAAISDVSLTLALGASLGIIGPSGCGKTTLTRLILGLLKPDSGDIQVRGRVGFVPQDPYASLDPAMTVFQLIAEPLRFTGRARRWRDCKAQVRTAIDAVHMDFIACRDRLPSQLSGGERQRVSIARALVLEPELLVLDEPTSMLDQAVKGEIVDLLARIAADGGRSFLMVTHDIAVSAAVCQTIVVMDQGRVLESGPARQVLCQPREELSKRLVLAAADLRRYWAEGEGTVSAPQGCSLWSERIRGA